MNAEITWDLVMLDDMAFAEGCFRLEGESWQVFTARKCREGEQPTVRKGLRWASGVTGINITLSRAEPLNKAMLLRVMSSALGIKRWIEVSGPDSIMLR